MNSGPTTLNSFKPKLTSFSINSSLSIVAPNFSMKATACLEIFIAPIALDKASV
jgi:hypothetical protein